MMCGNHASLINELTYTYKPSVTCDQKAGYHNDTIVGMARKKKLQTKTTTDYAYSTIIN